MNFKLKHMPSTPMTQKEMEEQCRIFSEVASGAVMEEDEGFISEDIELRSVQDMLGCEDCRFSDKEKIGYENCCSYLGKLQVIEGKCSNRKGNTNEKNNNY